MKTFLFLMIAVSAWGQSKPARSKAGAIAPCHFRAEGCSDQPRCPTGTSYPPGSYMDCYNPTHKPKPSVKKDTITLGPEICDYGFNGAVTGCASSQKPADPCDGFACTKPVEKLQQQKKEVCVPGSRKDKNGICYATMMVPDKAAPPDGSCPTGVDEGPCYRVQLDKAAVPVEPSLSCEGFGEAAVCSWNDGAADDGPPTDWSLYVKQMKASDGSSVVHLEDSEYSHLQQLRAAVVEEEKRLAVKYGARVGMRQIDCLNATRMGAKEWKECDWDKLPVDDDHYEYKGQFLLIDKGGK